MALQVLCHLGKRVTPSSSITTPGVQFPWSFYGKRLCLPETKTFRCEVQISGDIISCRATGV